MKSSGKALIGIFGIYLIVIAFQNCSPTDSQTGNNNNVPSYLTMEASNVESMVDSVATMCSTASSATSMGPAPSTINVGNSSMPVNFRYSLSGGTTSITQAYGNIFITGTGTVTLDGSVTGNVVICGPSVSLARGGGNLFLQNANIGTITSFTGNILIDGGEPSGTITDFTGNLAWQYGGTTHGRTYTGQ